MTFSSRGAVIGRAEVLLRDAIMLCLRHDDASARRCLDRCHAWIYGEIGPPGELQRETIVRQLPTELTDEGDVIIRSEISLGFDAFGESVRWRSAALCRWLRDGVHDAELWQRSAREAERHYREHPQELSDGSALSFLSSAYVMSGNYEACIKLLEGQTKFPVPENGSTNVRSPRGMSYIVASHSLGGGWTHEELAKSYKSFFRRYMLECANGGQLEEIAQWMKLAFWREAGDLSPEMALRKVMDYLPTE